MAATKRSAERAKSKKLTGVDSGQGRRFDITDKQWAFIQPLIPPRTAKTGRKPRDPREMLNGMLWILRTGAPWRDLPERFGPWQTAYDYFCKWRKQGVYGKILQALHIRLDQKGQMDWDLWCSDGSIARATRAAAGAGKKVSNATKTSRKTMLWAARAADSQASSIWLLTAAARR